MWKYSMICFVHSAGAVLDMPRHQQQPSLRQRQGQQEGSTDARSSSSRPRPGRYGRRQRPPPPTPRRRRGGEEAPRKEAVAAPAPATDGCQRHHDSRVLAKGSEASGTQTFARECHPSKQPRAQVASYSLSLPCAPFLLLLYSSIASLETVDQYNIHRPCTTATAAAAARR